MRRRKCCNPALAFGVGLLAGTFCPAGFVLFIAAIMIIVLAIAYR